MQRRVGFALRIAAIGIVFSIPASAYGADGKGDHVEAAVARAADLADRTAAVAKEAAEQKAQLEAIRAGFAAESRERAETLANLQKRVAELSAAVEQRKAAEREQAGLAEKLQAKDKEIASLRAELEKATAEKATAEKVAAEKVAAEKVAAEKAKLASQTVGQDRQAIAVAASAPAEALPKAEAEAIPPPPDGTAIKKWQQPDGSLFFGERPPQGSKFVGYTTGRGL